MPKIGIYCQISQNILNWLVICLGQDADLHMAQLMPLPFTVSCSSRSRLFYLPGFTFLVPSDPGTHTAVLWPPWILSGTTRVSRYQKGITNLDLLEQEIVSGSGISWPICKSAPKHWSKITLMLLGIRKSIQSVKIKWWGLFGARCRWFAYGLADVLPSHHLLPHLNPEWFYLSDAGFSRLSWKWGH